MSTESRVPPSSSIQGLAPLTGFRSRRGSLASLSSHGPVDKEALAQVLDDIHVTASRSETLTSFSDFDQNGAGRAAGPKEIVTSRISGLYSRLKQSVGGGSPESVPRSTSRNSLALPDAISVRSTSGAAPKIASFASEERNETAYAPTAATLDASTIHDARPIPPTSATVTAPATTQEQLRNKIADSPRTITSPRFSAPVPDSSSLASPLNLSFSKDTASINSEAQGEDTEAATKTQRTVGAAAVEVHDKAAAQSQSQAPLSKPVVELDSPFATEDESIVGRGNRTSNKAGKRVSIQSHHSTSTPDAKLSGAAAQRRPQTWTKSATPTFTRNETDAIAPTDHVSSNDERRRGRLVSQSHLPNFQASRTSSTTDGGENLLGTSGQPVSKPHMDASVNINAGFRRPANRGPSVEADSNTVVPAHIRRRVVSKEFWMKDENARDCFHCGDAFSTFRRKHHCRTCGQIFDAKCTILVSGRPFDQPSTLRLCKPCEAVIYGSDDDSTVFSDDEDGLRASNIGENARNDRSPLQLDGAVSFRPERSTLAAPSIGIPVSRRDREAKRRSAVIEFDAHPVLARPSSSRSLKSLSGRPRSSSHKRHQSRHQGIRGSKQAEQRGPFYQDATDMARRVPLPAFHNDNVIDPDLAPFMSDEGSDDGQPSLFATLNGDGQGVSPVESERAGFAGLLASAVKKGRSRFGERNVVTPSVALRDPDTLSLSGKHAPRLARKRNTSIGSMALSRPSPRRSRSQNMLNNWDEGVLADHASSPLTMTDGLPPRSSGSKMKRSAAMRGLDAPAIELNRASLQHVRKLLAQLLKDNNVSGSHHWEKALMPILLQCTDDVDPDVQRGDDMDVRNYIKLKKIPGGRPGDSAYVSGVVFSRNIALKSMRRSFVKPRIVIVTFAIEYARHNQHFMSLEPVIAQEREYLRSLVGRIAALRPQVLLVQRNVSGLALLMLQEAGITVVYNVKASVLAAVARVTQTVLVKTVDKLSIDPSHLGQCDNFEVKTYVHDGIKKTYVFISGCQPSLGCTIVLRGASTRTLRQVKRIAEFMCYVVYNLKLETCLMRDEFVLIPSIDDSIVPTVEAPFKSQRTKALSPNADAMAQLEAELQNAERANDSENETVLLMASGVNNATSIAMNEVEADGKHKGAEAEVVGDESADNDPEAESMPSQWRNLVDISRTRIISSSPFVKYVEPYLLVQAQEQERKVEKFRRLRDQYMNDDYSIDEKTDELGTFEMVRPNMIQEAQPRQQSKAMRDFLLDVHEVQYKKALAEYETKKKQWHSFFEGSNGDPFDPFHHQNIFVLQSLVSTITSAPCAGPEVIGLSFYAGYSNPDLNYQEDFTLGQFVEDICVGVNTACQTCNRKMFDHHRQYVHGSGQLSVSVKRYPARIKGLHNSILMWSSCKKCDQETTVIPMSDNTWKYSLGKYLELSFWSTPLKPRANLCNHDIHKDFVRCFGFQDLCVRVQYDNIEIYDVHVPSSTLNWAVSSDLTLKNQLYSDFLHKLTTFIGSIKARLQSINLSTVAPEKSVDATAALEKLVHRADNDHDDLLKKLQTKYMSSRFYEVIPLNKAMRAMDEKAISWDEAFADFERGFFPSETDIRRLATLQLKKLFLDRNEAVVPHASDLQEGVEMQDRTPTQRMSLTDEELQSEKGQSMLSSVVEEHGHSNPSHDDLALEHAVTVKSVDLAPGEDDLVRKLSPSETEQAVSQEGVKHLDLAVPVVATEPPDVESFSSLERSRSIGIPVPNSPKPDSDAFATDPRPLNSTILERIEQMRTAAMIPATGESLPESRIPRLADLHKRNLAGAVSPPLGRTQSQPSHVPRRSVDVELPSNQHVTSGEQSDGEGRATPPLGTGPGRDLTKTIEQRLADRLGTGHFRAAKAQNSLIPRSVPQKTDTYNTTRVSALAKHFEQLSREFERERLRERKTRAARSRQNRANPLASSQPVVEVYRDATEAVGGRTDESRTAESDHVEQSRDSLDIDQTSSDQTHELTHNDSEMTDHETVDHDTDTEHGESTLEHAVSDTEADHTDTEQASIDALPHRRDMSDPTSGMSPAALLSSASTADIELALPKHEKSSLMKVLTSFWSERSASGWSPLEYPLLPTEHVFDDSDIIVREDEPSSVIALALSSTDYTKKLREFRQAPKATRLGHTHTSSSGSALPPDEAKTQASIEASLISETGTHMKYSFAHGPVKAQCKIFYAESFDALRRKCGVSERFVESLSRSVKWDSKGGKTKSLFLKTLDDRFVIKSLQEVELKAFTKFAPDYFAFMSHTLFHGVPSVIAKMFGLFQVVIRNPATGVEFSSYLLVMENLFYDRRPTRRFDLKGSMRNRKIESTGQPDEVLLDENLVETIFETPLFVREHARKLVKASVWNDTMWLCKQNVMDYSLMAGFDDERKQLFIGIIDCIRTYTWDKKLESWIKDRGKNKPTITSPKDYRNRFRVSMMQYVLQAPNVYHEFSRQLPLPTSLKALEEQQARRSGGGAGERAASVEGEAHLMDEATMREMGTVMV